MLAEKPVLFECFFGKSTNKYLVGIICTCGTTTTSVLYVVQDDLKPKFAHRRGCSIYGLRMLWDQYRHHKYVFRDCSMCNGCHDL